jgi:uncharacterized protein (DUF305 family)
MPNIPGPLAALSIIAAAASSLASCRSAVVQQSPPIVQPGAPGESSRLIARGAAEDLPQPKHTAADVAFMQGMIGHHAQAVEMTGLLRTRTSSDAMKKLAQRIEVSQTDEITMMREWLESRGAVVPDAHAHHAQGARLMPGMLTPEDMQRLAGVSGPAFDRLFLEYMMKHHEGALVMVRELFAAPGAAQESEMYAFASDVEADQRMEIIRMAAMLKELQK